jgi:hypothetical protein
MLQLAALRFHPLQLLSAQAGQKPRIPPLRSVIPHRDAQRLLLPDEHEQPLSPRDSGINQVPLQEHVVLRGERDHDCRELRPLRLVNGDRIGERHFVQFVPLDDKGTIAAACDVLRSVPDEC